MDTATPRTIRIGKSTIGLIGIDIALHQAAAKNLSEDDAVIFFLRLSARKIIFRLEQMQNTVKHYAKLIVSTCIRMIRTKISWFSAFSAKPV